MLLMFIFGFASAQDGGFRRMVETEGFKDYASKSEAAGKKLKAVLKDTEDDDCDTAMEKLAKDFADYDKLQEKASDALAQLRDDISKGHAEHTRRMGGFAHHNWDRSMGGWERPRATSAEGHIDPGFGRVALDIDPGFVREAEGHEMYRRNFARQIEAHSMRSAAMFQEYVRRALVARDELERVMKSSRDHAFGFSNRFSNGFAMQRNWPDFMSLQRSADNALANYQRQMRGAMSNYRNAIFVPMANFGGRRRVELDMGWEEGFMKEAQEYETLMQNAAREMEAHAMRTAGLYQDYFRRALLASEEVKEMMQAETIVQSLEEQTNALAAYRDSIQEAMTNFKDSILMQLPNFLTMEQQQFGFGSNDFLPMEQPQFGFGSNDLPTMPVFDGPQEMPAPVEEITSEPLVGEFEN